MNPKELREKRAALIKEARGILDKADTEKRGLDAQEQERYEKLFGEAQGLKSDIDRREKQAEVERELASAQPRKTETQEAGDPDEAGRRVTPKEEVVELRQSVMGDDRRVHLTGETATPEYLEMFRRFFQGGERVLTAEERALQVDSDTGGGYLQAPQQFVAELIKRLDDDVFFRQIARVLPPLAKAESLGAPSLDADPADPIWTSELSIGDEDTTMKFGKRELNPHPLAKFIKVSKTLLRRAALPVDEIVRSRLAYKLAVVQENAFLNGSGAMQPLGVFVASDNGIGTARDVATGNIATEIRFDGLKEAQFKLKAQYRRNSQWIFHRDGIKQIAKLKDGEGRYIWTQSVVNGQPDRILNLPIHESEYAPSTFTASKYVGILGDFRFYWIVDALTMTIQVLIELYAGTNQNAYLARLEADGMPVLSEAFARVKLGA